MGGWTLDSVELRTMQFENEMVYKAPSGKPSPFFVLVYACLYLYLYLLQTNYCREQFRLFDTTVITIAIIQGGFLTAPPLKSM